jgi:hypothetical protein
MTSLGNNLFLGSTKGSTSACSVYQYNGKAITELKTFSSYDQVSAYKSYLKETRTKK